MTFDKYKESCNRTLPSEYRKMDKSTGVVVGAMLYMYSNHREHALLDDIKKWLFYKKDVTNVEKAIEHNSPYKPSKDFISAKHINMDVLHAIIGMVTESVELLYGYLDGDAINVEEEIGDIEWYRAILFDKLNLSTDEVWNKNIMKLQKRYPVKFSTENAVNRNVDNELSHYAGSDFDLDKVRLEKDVNIDKP